MQRIAGYCVLIAGLALIAASAEAAPSTAERFQQASRQLVVEAEQAVQTGDLEQAQFRFEQALVADPANVQALMGLGRTNANMGRSDAAVRFYEQALALEPNNVAALRGKAEAQIAANDLDGADKTLTRLNKLCDMTGSCGARDSVRQRLQEKRAGSSQDG